MSAARSGTKIRSKFVPFTNIEYVDGSHLKMVRERLLPESIPGEWQVRSITTLATGGVAQGRSRDAEGCDKRGINRGEVSTRCKP